METKGHTLIAPNKVNHCEVVTRAPEISSSSTSSTIGCHASHVIAEVDNHLRANFGMLTYSTAVSSYI